MPSLLTKGSQGQSLLSLPSLTEAEPQLLMCEFQLSQFNERTRRESQLSGTFPKSI